MVTSAIIIFWGLAFLERPHRLGLAIIVTVIFIVAMSLFNGWLYRRSMAQAEQLAPGGPVSSFS